MVYLSHIAVFVAGFLFCYYLPKLKALIRSAPSEEDAYDSLDKDDKRFVNNSDLDYFLHTYGIAHTLKNYGKLNYEIHDTDWNIFKVDELVLIIKELNGSLDINLKQIQLRAYESLINTPKDVSEAITTYTYLAKEVTAISKMELFSGMFDRLICTKTRELSKQKELWQKVYDVYKENKEDVYLKNHAWTRIDALDRKLKAA